MLRIGVVQFGPKIGQVQANLATAQHLCRKIQPKSLDLLCFPEMAFSGYVFENAAAITPYLEHPRTGTTSQFCSDFSKRLQCYVLAGFPEKLSLTEDRKNDQVGANSAVLYGPDGEWIGGYRKTHLLKMTGSGLSLARARAEYTRWS